MRNKNNPRSDPNEIHKTELGKGGKSSVGDSSLETSKGKGSIDQPALDPAMEAAKNSVKFAERAAFKDGSSADKVADNSGKTAKEGVDAVKKAVKSAESGKFKDNYSADKVAENAGKAAKEGSDVAKHAGESAESVSSKAGTSAEKVAENARKAAKDGVDVVKHAGESAERASSKVGTSAEKVAENARKAAKEEADVAKRAVESPEGASFKGGSSADKVAENVDKAGSSAKGGIRTGQSSADVKKGAGGGKGISEGIGKSSAQVSQPKTNIRKNLSRFLKTSKFALPTTIAVSTIIIAGGIYLGTKVIPPKADPEKVGAVSTPGQSESGIQPGQSDDQTAVDSPQENLSSIQEGGSGNLQTDLSGWWIFTGTLTTNNPEEDSYKYNNWQIEVKQEGTILKGYDGDGHEVINGSITGNSIEFELHIDNDPTICGDYSIFQGTRQSNGTPEITGSLTGHDCEYSSEWEGEFTIKIVK